jgi:hypothetical protein
MRDGMPLSYLIFRTAWSVIHLVLLAACFALLYWWAISDGHGAAAFSAWSVWSESVFQTVFHLIPFPWG